MRPFFNVPMVEWSTVVREARLRILRHREKHEEMEDGDTLKMPKLQQNQGGRGPPQRVQQQ